MKDPTEAQTPGREVYRPTGLVNKRCKVPTRTHRHTHTQTQTRAAVPQKKKETPADNSQPKKGVVII
jgi:hypothetical protein